MLKITLNQPVIDFTFDSTAGLKRQFWDFKGKSVVLYFYPKDNTSGCTCQAQNFRDHYPEFQQKGTVIVGVSRDSLTSHAKFQAAFNLPFELISDKSEQLCQLFDVIKPKTMYGKPVRGIERSTFLIDPQGVLRREWRKVKVEGHVEEVLAAVPI